MFFHVTLFLLTTFIFLQIEREVPNKAGLYIVLDINSHIHFSVGLIDIILTCEFFAINIVFSLFVAAVIVEGAAKILLADRSL